MTTRLVNPDDLVGLWEIAERFDVPRSTAMSWVRIRDFPQPVRSFKMGPCWLYDDIAEWRKNPGRRRVR